MTKEKGINLYNKKEFEQAFEIFNSISQKDSDILTYLGNIEYQRKNYKQAVEYFKIASDLKNIKAQYNLGHCYYMGIGIIKNYKKSFMYFMSSALENDKFAQKKVGDCYLLGDGVEKNIDTAIKWYIKASSNDNKDAQKLLETIKDKKTLDYILIGINAKYQTPLIFSPKNEALFEIIKNIEKSKIQL